MPDRQRTSATGGAPEPSSGPRAGRTRLTDSATAADTATNDERDLGTDESDPTEARDALPGWPPRDFLAPFVLLAVSLERSHGYVIEDYLRALGVFGITMSTLYRTLRQMEKDGFLESTWEPGPTGPARRVYTITDAGHLWLDSSAAMLSAYRETIDRFFGLYGAGSGAARQQQPESPDEKESQT